MSGGGDSSVTALVFKNEGYQVQGAILRIRDTDMTPEDIANGKLPQSIWYSRETARRLRIGFSIQDARQVYREKVLEPLLNGFANGVQRDPEILCNQQLKRPMLLQLANQLGCSLIATGHYAIISYDPYNSRYLLRKSVDTSMDQSYMLYYLSQEELARLRTPLGSYTKEEIRWIAREARLKNAAAPESIVLDSLPDERHMIRVEQLLQDFYGEGAVQDYRQRTAQRNYADVLQMGEVNYVSIPGFREETASVSVKLRYLPGEKPGTVAAAADGTLKIQLAAPIEVIPGQSIVLYHNDLVLAGGVLLPGGD